MRRARERLSGAAGCALLLAACSPAPAPQPAPSPPVVENPVDLTPRAEKPCSPVTEKLKSQLGLGTQQEQNGQEILRSTGTRQPACQLSTPDSSLPSLILFLLPEIRPLPVVQGWGLPSTQLTARTVRGYPAAVWRLGADSAAIGACNVVVDLGERQGIVLTYHRQSGPGTDPCEPPQQAADTVVANLTR